MAIFSVGMDDTYARFLCIGCWPLRGHVRLTPRLSQHLEIMRRRRYIHRTPMMHLFRIRFSVRFALAYVHALCTWSLFHITQSGRGKAAVFFLCGQSETVRQQDTRRAAIGFKKGGSLPSLENFLR